MTKKFATLCEDVRPCPTPTEPVSESEAMALIKKFKKVFNVLDAGFNMSYHALVERLNHPRNKPPISACEFEFVMTQFVKKNSKQLMDDIWDVKNRKVTPRGKRADQIRPNNYEYGITSRSTGLAIIMSIQPDPKNRGGARINIITVMRKRGFGVNQGEHIMVEGFEPTNITWFAID